MGQGPNVTDEMAREIALIWRGKQGVSDGIKKCPKILEELQKRHKDDKPLARLPNVRTIQSMVKKLKKAVAAAAKEAGNPDRPWSLGATVNIGLTASPETNKTLLSIYKWCKVVGRPFSVREAKWVVLLQGSCEDKYLLHEAEEYAAREWACDMLVGQTLDTSDLDARLLFPGPCELDAGKQTGAIPKVCENQDDIRTLKQRNEKRPYLFEMESPDVWVEQALCFEALRELIKRSRREHEESIKTYYTYPTRLSEIQTEHKLRGNERIVYAFWLRKIGTTNIWQTLSFGRRLDFFRELRESVRVGIQAQMANFTFLNTAWKPTEILKKFGLD